MAFTKSDLLMRDAEYDALTKSLASADQPDPIPGICQEVAAKVARICQGKSIDVPWQRNLVRALTVFELYSRANLSIPKAAADAAKEANTSLDNIQANKYGTGNAAASGSDDKLLHRV